MPLITDDYERNSSNYQENEEYIRENLQNDDIMSVDEKIKFVKTYKTCFLIHLTI